MVGRSVVGAWVGRPWMGGYNGGWPAQDQGAAQLGKSVNFRHKKFGNSTRPVSPPRQQYPHHLRRGLIHYVVYNVLLYLDFKIVRSLLATYTFKSWQ